MGPSLTTIGDDASVAQALQLVRAHQIHHLPVLHGSELVGLMCTCDLHDAPPDSPVAQWMSRPAVTLDASATLQDAAQTMRTREVGSVIVTVQGQPRGIVTRGDLLQAEPSTEDLLIHARCECCGLTRHLSTAADGHTFCTYCRDDAGDTQPSLSIPALAPPAHAARRAPHLETLETHPLASLIGEHRLIGQLAEALRCFSVCVECQSTTYDRADLAKFARVFRDLGDCMHHEKEETVLLPLLAHLGFDWEDGPLANVRQDHCQERYLIEVLCHAAERDGAWSNEDRRRVAATARELGEFQCAHLERENTLLFPVVMQRLSENELRLLQGELRTFDIRLDRHMPRAELTALALDLIQRYLPAPLVEGPTSFSVQVELG